MIDWHAAFAFWEWSDDLLVLVHMCVALAALLLGQVIFLRVKGDLTHRLLGLGYVIAMILTNVTALMIYDFTGGPNLFHFLALVSLATAFPGLAFGVLYGVKKHKKALAAHIDLMSWSYFGLFMAAGAEAFTRGLGPQLNSYKSFWIVFGVYMLVAGGIGNFVTLRLIQGVKGRWLQDSRD